MKPAARTDELETLREAWIAAPYGVKLRAAWKAFRDAAAAQLRAELAEIAAARPLEPGDRWDPTRGGYA